MTKNRKLRYERVRNPVLKQGATTAKIKVRLDSRTVITIHTMSALKMWKSRYPDATVIS